MNILTTLKDEFALIPKTQRKLRSFGIMFGVIFLTISLFLYIWSNEQHELLFLLGLTFLFVSYFLPMKFYYLYRIWMGFGIIIGLVVNKVILTLIFYILISPTAFIYRLFKQKPHNETTFWIKRSEIADDASINQQF